jgi:hypothetical protein
MKFIINKYINYFYRFSIEVRKHYKIVILLILTSIVFLDIFFDFISYASILDPVKKFNDINFDIMVDFRTDVTYYRSSELGYWGQKLKTFAPNGTPGTPFYSDQGDIISVCYKDFEQLLQILKKGTPASSGMTDKDIHEIATEMHRHAEICRKFSTAGTKDPVFNAVILRPIKPGDPMYCIFCKLKDSLLNKLKGKK